MKNEWSVVEWFVASGTSCIHRSPLFFQIYHIYPAVKITFETWHIYVPICEHSCLYAAFDLLENWHPLLLSNVHLTDWGTANQVVILKPKMWLPYTCMLVYLVIHVIFQNLLKMICVPLVWIHLYKGKYRKQMRFILKISTQYLLNCCVH